MKNIYNLLTDAFTRIGKNESDYTVTVEGHYTVIITSRNGLDTRSASLRLYMRNNGELYNFRDENTLFTENDWEEFCTVIDRMIPASFMSASDLLQLIGSSHSINATEDEFE